MSVSLTVMTFNLLEDQPDDSPNSWEKRKNLCVTVITSYSPMILCTQQGSFLFFLCLILSFNGILFLIWLSAFLRKVRGEVAVGLSAAMLAWHTYVGQKGMNNLESRGKDPKILPISTAQSFMTRKRLSYSKVELFGSQNLPQFLVAFRGLLQILLKGVEPPGFSFQIVNTNMDEFSPRARRRGALLTWQHIASLPPNLPVLYCGGFNTQKESTAGRFLLGRSREHGVVGDMRDAWPSARVRKNVPLIRTYHGFKGDKQGTVEFLKLIFRALCLCWDRQTQDLHVDWILFRGRSLIPVLCEVVSDNVDGYYPSSHYPIFAEFMLPRTVRLAETPAQD
ncbi:DNAse I-like superfamily protein [Striga asiatica]|uniref:DNAse I-like superfamily protein n=1 Tax=Striga asiatica TaxID=4170 RepID=A0A5A7QEJ9_STRAF|nr:DNAse I-like superfamily protein [Striga asiatica]